ncbi:hypothetical protein N7540_006266 [Penicillium herquei]|nr:hypothetical protein N7540_006266 [Penicillium herquei]
MVLLKGVPWVPVFGRYYALTGRHAQVNGSFVDSWLLNRKAEPYSDAGHKDIHFWLRQGYSLLAAHFDAHHANYG